jgi:histone H3/H4
MATSRDRAIQSTQHLLEALGDLRIATRATETSIRRALKKTERGGDVSEALVALTPSGLRQSMNVALEAVEKARHEARLTVFAMGLEQGMSIGELGRMFGFSRQLAARYAKEARGKY